MINNDEFRKLAHEMADWMADYYKDIEKYPVKPDVAPGEIYDKLPDNPPVEAESMERIISDFEADIMPGMTHWQSPNYFAYFTANASYPSLLAEMLTSALAAQCMIWDTSPAAAELEEQMMNWLRDMTGLPGNWEGVIQDGASTATLTSLLTAREKKTNFLINENGFMEQPIFRIYCSTEAHSSIEKSAKIAGFGRNNVVKVAVDEDLAMCPDELEKAIAKDLSQGYQPLAVVAAIGTTGTTAVDPIEEIGRICEKNNIWFHVDAAFSGTALVLPEFRWMIKGIERANTFVFNPHKWMFTHFDCSAYFVKETDLLVRTFEILPEYLKTFSMGKVKDYRDWGIPMGRRFRALKLWFVIRSFGVKGIQDKVRMHIALAKDFESEVKKNRDFSVMSKRLFNLVCFRFTPADKDDGALDALNKELEKKLNESGKIFLTHTKVDGKYTLRMVIGQTSVEASHVKKAWKLIQDTASGLL